jgi:hypothetical protein
LFIVGKKSATSWNRHHALAFFVGDSLSKEDLRMIRMMCAAIAALAFIAVSDVSQAAPIAPLSAGVASASKATPVYWHHRHCWWRHGYRHCW